MSIKNPLLFPNVPNILIGPNKQNHQLTEKQDLQLLAWTVSGKSYLQKKYQKSLPSLLQMPEDQGQSLNTNRPCVNGIADVVGEKSIPLDVLWGMWCKFYCSLKSRSCSGILQQHSIWSCALLTQYAGQNISNKIKNKSKLDRARKVLFLRNVRLLLPKF